MATEPYRLPELKPTERYEYKYLVPEEWVGPLSRAVEPYCEQDRNMPDPRGYAIHGLYLDSPGFACYRAKRNRHYSRFKLRIRSYDLAGDGPLFLEVKRKVGDVIVKHRGRLARADWPGFLETGRLQGEVAPGDALGRFYEHCAILQARPVLFVTYRRVAYSGILDDYARVTFDRELRVQAAHDWSLAADATAWRVTDTPTALGQRSQVVLELKFARAMPCWMASLVDRFELVRVGFSKYCTGIVAAFGPLAPGREPLRIAAHARDDRGHAEAWYA